MEIKHHIKISPSLDNIRGSRPPNASLKYLSKCKMIFDIE